MPDDDAARRQDDARLANEARVAALALVKAREDRESFWDRLGWNVRSDGDGIEQLKLGLAWAVRSQKRASLLGKRVIQWVTILGTVITVFGVLLDIYLKVKGAK